MIELGSLRFAWEVFVTALSLLAFGAVSWLSLTFAKRSAVDGLATDWREAEKKQDERLARIEQQLRTMPSHADLVRLASIMTDVGNRVSKLEGASEQQNHLLQAIHDHLLNEKKS